MRRINKFLDRVGLSVGLVCLVVLCAVLGSGVGMGLRLPCWMPDQPTAQAQIIPGPALQLATTTMGQTGTPVRYLGDETFADLSSASALTPTNGATYAEIVCATANIRMRGGGNDPTNATGRIIFAGDGYIVPKPSASYKLIEAVSANGGTAFVVYWGP